MCYVMDSQSQSTESRVANSVCEMCTYERCSKQSEVNLEKI